MATTIQLHPKHLTLPSRALLTAVLAFSAVPGFCATTPYESAVTSDSPVAYYRFNDPLARGNVNANSGSLGTAGSLTNTYTLRAIPGAIAAAATAPSSSTRAAPTA